MSPASRPWHTRIATAAAIAAALACVGVPAVRAVVRTAQAGAGEDTPVAAANAYLRAVFESGDSLAISRCLCSDNRDELFREARDLRRQVEPYTTFGVKVESSDWRTSDSDGTVSARVNLRFTQIDPATGSVTFTGGPVHEWRFRTRDDGGISGGWKVCDIDAPPMCDMHLRC